MIKHNCEISFLRFEILCSCYKINLSYKEKNIVYEIFKDIFKYDKFFTFIDEDSERLKFTLNCKYVIEQICIEKGLL